MKARRRRLTRWLVAGGLGVLLLGGLYLLDRRPVHLSAFDARDTSGGRGGLALRPETAGCLLVTSRDRIDRSAEARRFSMMDWSLAWTNTLEQELGWYGHRDVTELASLLPGKLPPVVILTRSAVHDLRPDDVARLREEVRRGLVLVLEQPDEGWSELSGVELRGPAAEVSRLSAASPGLIGAEVLMQVARLPLPAARLDLRTPLAEDVRTVLYMDDRPAMVTRPYGDGWVLSLAFDLGRTLVTVQQGLPEDDFGVRKRWGFYEEVLESHDLVWDAAYLDTTVPAADVLERAVLAAIRRHAPLPGWWPLPDAAPGLLLMTHDEDGYEAPMCRPLLEHEVQVGARSTWFVIAHPRVDESWLPADVEEFAAAGADLQLHWNRLPMPRGVWKIEPLHRVHSLREQARLLQGALEDGGLEPGPWLNRNHYLMWGSLEEHARGTGHYTRTFRTLVENGVALDATYGPNRGAKGYLFGTGRPWYPLDTDGRRFPLRELPFVSQEDWGGETEDWWRRMFAGSRDHYHSALSCIIHPHLIVREPEGRRLVESIYRLAAEHDHPALDLRTYVDFLDARRASPLRTSRRGRDRTFHVEARAPGMHLYTPLRLDERVLLNDAPVRPKELRVDGRRVFLIEVPVGKHRIVVRRGE